MRLVCRDAAAFGKGYGRTARVFGDHARDRGIENRLEDGGKALFYKVFGTVEGATSTGIRWIGKKKEAGLIILSPIHSELASTGQVA